MALDIGFSKTKTSKAVLLQITCFFGGKTVSISLTYRVGYLLRVTLHGLQPYCYEIANK